MNNRMFFKKPTYNGPLLRNFFKKMNCWYMNNVEESKKKKLSKKVKYLYKIVEQARLICSNKI